jgi:hypothetical protein
MLLYNRKGTHWGRYILGRCFPIALRLSGQAAHNYTYYNSCLYWRFGRQEGHWPGPAERGRGLGINHINKNYFGVRYTSTKYMKIKKDFCLKTCPTSFNRQPFA